MYNELVRKDSNCSVLLDGKRIDRKGYFMSPFVYKTEWGHKKFLKEEVFGPHVALVPFKTVEEGIHIYNDTEFGLALGVVTEDFRVMRKCRDDCRAGMIYLNGGSVAAESHLPFGGLGKSGFGGKSAAGAFRTVTDELAVTTNYEKGITWAQGLK
jgi:aldehyde dehydrogenase (NAD+)